MPFRVDAIDFGTIKEVRARSSECGLCQLVLDPRVQVEKEHSEYQGCPPPVDLGPGGLRRTVAMD